MNSYIENLRKNHEKKPSIIVSTQTYDDYSKELLTLRELREDLQDKILNTLVEVNITEDKMPALRKLVEDDLRLLSTFAHSREERLKVATQVWIQDNPQSRIKSTQRVNPPRNTKSKASDAWQNLKPKTRQRNRRGNKKEDFEKSQVLTDLMGEETESLAWENFDNDSLAYSTFNPQPTKKGSEYLQEQVETL